MAPQLAGHALNENKDVVLFFNVRGVSVPTKTFPIELAFHEKPITTLLQDLLARGAEVHVCQHCMNAMGITVEDSIDGAVMTDSKKLFAHLGSITVVFTY
jgi:sulfur relay (sulfurtransferase) complex TusBCD TusD component (DsrE family)